MRCTRCTRISAEGDLLWAGTALTLCLAVLDSITCLADVLRCLVCYDTIDESQQVAALGLRPCCQQSLDPQKKYGRLQPVRSHLAR